MVFYEFLLLFLCYTVAQQETDFINKVLLYSKILLTAILLSLAGTNLWKKHIKISHRHSFDHVCCVFLYLLPWKFIGQFLIQKNVLCRYKKRWKSSIKFENTLKTQWNQRAVRISQINLACRYIKMCVLIRHIFCESLWSYVLLNINAVNFCDIIFTHRTMFSTCPNKEPQKSRIGSR